MSAHLDYMRQIREYLSAVGRWTDAIDPRDLPRKRDRYVPDAVQRRDIVATLRNAVPDIDAVAGLRAARTLGGMRNDPYYRDAVAAYLAQAGDGIELADIVSPIPAPFTSRNHQTRPTRSRKGRTSFKVDRRGMAQVIGSTSRCAAPYATDAPDAVDTVERGWLTASLDLIPRKGYGRSSLAVLRVTDYRLSRYDVPALLGTDLTMFASVIDADVSDRSACAVQRCAIAAGDSPLLDRFAQSDAVYAANTRRVARFVVSRQRLRAMVARLTDPCTVVVVKTRADGKESRRARFVPRVSYRLATPDCYNVNAAGYGRYVVRVTEYVAPCDRVAARSTVETSTVETLPATHRGYWSRGAWHSREILPAREVRRETSRDVLATAPADHMWIGHTLTARGETSTRKSARDTASAARTAARIVGTVDAPSTVDAWQVLAECTNRGEGYRVVYPDGLTRTLSRADDGRYALTLPDGRRVRARSAASLATRAA